MAEEEKNPLRPTVTFRDKKHKLFTALQLKPTLDKKDPLREHLRRLSKSARS